MDFLAAALARWRDLFATKELPGLARLRRIRIYLSAPAAFQAKLLPSFGRSRCFKTVVRLIASNCGYGEGFPMRAVA